MSAPVSAAPVPGVSPTPVESPAPSPSPAHPRSQFAAIPKPSLKPGEVITWIKLERPKFAIGEILIGSFALAGAVFLVSIGVGLLLGHFRSKRTRTHGTQGLGLR